jgi:hypothetical protein
MLSKFVFDLAQSVRPILSGVVARVGVGMAMAVLAMLLSMESYVYAQTARTAYGHIEIPAQNQSSNARHSASNSMNRGAAEYQTILGPQSTPSATTRASNGSLSIRNSHPAKRSGYRPMGRASDRLGRGRVIAAGFQESIDTGEVAEPAELPSANPIPDVTGADEGMMSGMAPDGAMHNQQYSEFGAPSMMYANGHGEVYCDGCGDMGCGCGLRNHGGDYFHECRLRLAMGALGFNNAMNYAGEGTNVWSGDGSGSFGFQQSLQWSTPVPGLFYGEMGAQVGVRTVQANLAGAEFTADGRNQLYLTAGLFRRSDYGLQGGLVIDYLAERWYLNTDLVQLRGELSYMFEPNHEFGFRFTSGMQSSSSGGFILNDVGVFTSTDGTFSAVDQYRLFTRHVLSQEQASYLELSAGWSDEKHGILGAMIETVVSSQINIQSSFTMGIPGDAVSEGDHQQEQWQVGLMLVWTPSRPCINGLQDYYRPLFEVADPGSFWVGRVE